MSAEIIIRILREGLLLVVLLSAAPMLASMLVGLIVGIFQATTQIQEQTLSYVPKLIAVFTTLAIIGPWAIAQAVRFSTLIFDNIVLVR
jgi:flagellar biosynthetic protein FliQ